MLEITVPEREFFDEDTEMFYVVPGAKLQLEHSLVSLSKWESKYEKPFLSNESKTDSEKLDYIRCMILNDCCDPRIVYSLSGSQIKIINDYIEKKHTATTISERPGSSTRSGGVITSEIIYYWMISYNVPMECQYWNLNRLITLIRVVSEKSQPAKKMSKTEAAAKMRALNAQRRKEMGTSG